MTQLVIEPQGSQWKQHVDDEQLHVQVARRRRWSFSKLSSKPLVDKVMFLPWTASAREINHGAAASMLMDADLFLRRSNLSKQRHCTDASAHRCCRRRSIFGVPPRNHREDCVCLFGLLIQNHGCNKSACNDVIELCIKM